MPVALKSSEELFAGQDEPELETERQELGAPVGTRGEAGPPARIPAPEALPGGVGRAAEALLPPGLNRPPEYPALALRRRLEGDVLLRIRVDAAGGCAGVEIVQSSGHLLLDRAAREAVTRWSFIPATREGRPVPGLLEVQILFRLEGVSAAQAARG